MNYTIPRTKRATEARESLGNTTDAAILKIIKEHPRSSLYEIAKQAGASTGLVDGSVRRLEEKGQVETRQVLRAGRIATEVFAANEEIKTNSPEITIEPDAFPNAAVWRETAYIYALNRSSIGISPEALDEWASKAMFEIKTNAKKDEARNILIEIPEKFRSFYLWENSTVEMSIVDELVLLNLVTEIPIVRKKLAEIHTHPLGSRVKSSSRNFRKKETTKHKSYH